MWKQDVDYMLTSVLTEIDSGDIYFFVTEKVIIENHASCSEVYEIDTFQSNIFKLCKESWRVVEKISKLFFQELFYFYSSAIDNKNKSFFSFWV